VISNHGAHHEWLGLRLSVCQKEKTVKTHAGFDGFHSACVGLIIFCQKNSLR